MHTGKSFVLDTSVILDSPDNVIALSQNGENQLFITDVVLKELNKRKEDMITEAGFFARLFATALDKGQNKQKNMEMNNYSGKGKKRVKVKKNKKDKSDVSYQKDMIQNLFCLFEGQDTPIEMNIIYRKKYEVESHTNDLKIVEIARDYNYTLITNDIYLKFEASSRYVDVESMQKGTINSPEMITFAVTITGTTEEKDSILEKELVNLKNWTQVTFEYTDFDKIGKKEYFLVRETKFGKEYKELNMKEIERRYKVPPINEEQKFYSEMLASDFDIAVVTGSTGSGKTLIAVQEGMRRVSDINDPINGIVYIRNTVTANDKASEMGFRKGDQDQKLGYFAYPLYGALNFIAQRTISKTKTDLNEQKEKIDTPSKEYYTEEMMKKYNIEVMDIAHARGITIPNKFIIIDEGQNAQKPTIKLIGTRAGKGSKLIIMGDYGQVDHPYLTENRNGLVSMLKIAEVNGDIAGIQLRKTIRSDIANWFQENF